MKFAVRKYKTSVGKNGGTVRSEQIIKEEIRSFGNELIKNAIFPKEITDTIMFSFCPYLISHFFILFKN